MYEGKIKNFLQRFGVGENYQGFHICAYSVKLAMEHPDWLCYITKGLYPETAKKFNTNCGCVERNIRTVAEIVWKAGGKEYFSKINKMPMENKRPTNAKFLAMLVSYAVSDNDVCMNEKKCLCDECKMVTECRQNNKWAGGR